MTSGSRARKLRLGVIGMSDGDGHPYSWSAIFNGYDPGPMEQCGFPVISEYLSEREYPRDYLGHLGQVTHVFTQDVQRSRHISSAALIPTVCECLAEMVGSVDAVLLARDDVETRLHFARPFLEASIPIFVDKLLARDLATAHELLDAPGGRIFTCSATRFASELKMTESDLEALGEPLHVEAQAPHSWSTYAIHALEPVIAWPLDRGELLSVEAADEGEGHLALLRWERLTMSLRTTGARPSSIKILARGPLGERELRFEDAFSAFRSALEYFVEWVNGDKPNLPREDVLEIVEVLERGQLS